MNLNKTNVNKSYHLPVRPKLVVILGPTATGKTGLALLLAELFNGEIISADSRQVYKKMAIGTSQPVGSWKNIKGRTVFAVEANQGTGVQIPHYLVDILDPAEQLTVAQFKVQALEHIYDITQRGKVPIMVGGTGLYIWSVVDNLAIPTVPPDADLRRNAEQKPLSELADWLKQLDPMAAARVDLLNPRRVIRALEIAVFNSQLGSTEAARNVQNGQQDGQNVGDPKNQYFSGSQQNYPTNQSIIDVLQIGITLPEEQLRERISKRVDTMMIHGLVNETKQLMEAGYDWCLPSMSSIGYRQISAYYHGEYTLDEAVAAIKLATRQYAKRQLTWFKRDKRIKWFNGATVDETREEDIKRIVQDFLIS